MYSPLGRRFDRRRRRRSTIRAIRRRLFRTRRHAIEIRDAWAMGKAVVTTRVGCEGLNARFDYNASSADDPREFAAAVLRVVRQPKLRMSLERAARETVVAEYRWEVICTVDPLTLSRSRAAREGSDAVTSFGQWCG